MTNFALRCLSLLFVAIFACVSAAKADIIICSKYSHFNAKSLLNFRPSDPKQQISDWSNEEPFSKDLTMIVIALPKSEVGLEYACIEQADQIAPGVKNAIKANASSVGTSPGQYDSILVGKLSGPSSFGPITTKTTYIRSDTLVVQVSVSDLPEPVRSINAIERFFDLPLGYCERNSNCGVVHGEP